MPALLDHLAMLLLAVVVPFIAVTEMRQLRARLAVGETFARMDWYRSTIRTEWGAAAVLVAAWALAGRGFGALGISLPAGSGFLVGMGVAILIAVALYMQASAATRSAASAAQVREAVGALDVIMPHTPAELASFTRVGVTAGIVEELVYRAYVMWYFAGFAPMWVALVASSVVFGLGHSYQGVRGIAKVTTIGLVLGGLYWLSGSIWVPMLVHVALDVLQGRMVFAVLREEPAAVV
jgi:membrane protease YdiL (CAAX protease family)